uniref:Uncharacterized protein n=1 Tax=Anguilla anguilla TaxID=7936 RepID=A0A0E9X174_ANGAN
MGGHLLCSALSGQDTKLSRSLAWAKRRSIAVGGWIIVLLFWSHVLCFFVRKVLCLISSFFYVHLFTTHLCLYLYMPGFFQ